MIYYLFRDNNNPETGLSVLAENETVARSILTFLLEEDEIANLEAWEIIDTVDVTAQNELIERIATLYQVNVIDLDVLGARESYCPDLSDFDFEFQYHNRSYIVGREEIILGFYDHPNLRLISFFHEIGHILVNMKHNVEKLSRYEFEYYAWIEGIQLAREYGIEFDHNVKEWANKQVESYADYK